MPLAIIVDDRLDVRHLMHDFTCTSLQLNLTVTAHVSLFVKFCCIISNACMFDYDFNNSVCNQAGACFGILT